MTLRLPLVMAAVLSICVFGVVLSWARADAMRSQMEAARVRYVSLQEDVTELERLRAKTKHAHADQPSEHDLLSRIRQVLRKAGIADRALKQVSRPGDQAVGRPAGGSASKYAQRTERVVLEPVRLPELGRWMRAWRSSEPLWTISRVQLRSTRETETSGAYAVTVDLTTVFINPLARTDP